MVNGYVYLKQPRPLLYISLVLTLPLLFMALGTFRKQPDQDESPGDKEPGSEIDLLEQSLAPYVAAIVICTVFIFVIYQYTQPGIFFFMPQIAGWNYLDGLILIVLGMALASCGLGIWSGHFMQRMGSDARLRATASYYLFKLNWSSGNRMTAYFIFLTLMWAMGVAAVMVVNGDTKIWYKYVIVAGRCTIPMTFVLIGAVLRMNAIPFLVLGAGCAAGLLGFNTGSWVDSAIFMGVPAALTLAYVAVVFSKTGDARKQQAASVPEPPAEEAEQEPENDEDTAPDPEPDPEKGSEKADN